MIKYFHKLTKNEFDEVVLSNITWEECAEKYPQPKWCSYPEAVQGIMGCWSLTSFTTEGVSMVRGRSYCKGCDLYIERRNLVRK